MRACGCAPLPAVVAADDEMLRPDAERQAIAVPGAARIARQHQQRAVVQPDLDPLVPPADHARLEKVHLGRADEARDEEVGGLVVEIERRADLLDPAQAQHHDRIRHGHGLDLIVGDVDHRRIDPLMQLGDLHPHLHPQLRIEVGERLVEQKDLRLADDRAADRDPLPLPARELRRAAVEQRLDLQDAGGLADPLRDQRLGRAHGLEPEGEVLADRHVRIERVRLEDHREAALGGVDLVDQLAVDEDLAVAHLLEPGDHPQQGRLAAAGRADEDHELAVLDLEVDAVDHLGVAEALDDPMQPQLSHHALPTLAANRDTRDVPARSAG